MKKKVSAILILVGLGIASFYWMTRRKLETVSGRGPSAGEIVQSGETRKPQEQSVPAAQRYPSQAQHQLSVLEEIFLSKNDNDPRMDSELRILSPQAKELLRARYETLSAESRNERGTIVFLLGRNINSSEDLSFFSEVLKEAACLSLTDCKAPPAAASAPDDGHWDAGTEVTLAYPQVVAVKALAKASHNDALSPGMKEQIRDMLSEAARTSVPAVASMAEKSTF